MGRDRRAGARKACIDSNAPMILALASNMRLKLTVPVVYGRIAFVDLTVWRRSLGAPR